MTNNLKKYVPSLAGKINLEELIAPVYAKVQPTLSGVYVPFDEQFEEGINGKEADKWSNANPFNTRFDKLDDRAKELIRDEFYKEIIRLIPSSYFSKSSLNDDEKDEPEKKTSHKKDK